ncbi:hypothetical protein HY792_06930, partial [Candidatus Desantisbacteria bacterium]|nr:hypothetical protein [Candidatus Desantisbacteria bacterium]
FLLLVLLLTVVGYFLFNYLRKWSLPKKQAEKESAKAAKPSQELALEAIGKIDPIEYFEKGKIKEFYFEITDIVRQFLADNYHIDTLNKTSLEIIEEIERVERDFTKVKELDYYFSECDLVKFAKIRPGMLEMKQKKTESEQIIREYFRHK